MNATLLTHRYAASAKARSIDLSSTLVIIDPGVADADKLAAGVLPKTTAIVLDPAQDGVLQITRILNARPAVTSLHIICHGEPGRLFLGNTQLSLDTLKRYAWDLQSWFSCGSHGPTAPSLLLYGCHVAAGAVGSEFLEHLHQFTGANIAASTSRTGSATQGGNWELEVSIGSVDQTLAFHPATLENYPATLATVNGKIWRDLDADGIQDVGEPQLQGVTVYLDADSDGQLDAGETSTITDASGSYTFTGLAAGTYTVAQVLQSGWQQTAPISVSSITGFRFAGGDNGDRLEPAGDGIALAGYTSAKTTDQAAIVIGNSRRTIVNGFSVDAALSDPEGLALATQEIQQLSAGVSNVLIFHALQGGEATTLFQTAADNLGLTSQVYNASNTAAFEAAVTAADPSNTLVIFTSESNSLNFTGLINHVNAGGRAILYFWGLNGNAALASAFQVATVGNRFSPEPIYTWSNSTATVADGATATVDFGTFIPNAAPTSANKTISTNEDTLYAFQGSDFAFTDTDNGDSLATVKIISLPSAGSLFLDGNLDDSPNSGEDISLNQEIAVADLSKLKFKPAENASGTGYAMLQFQVSDGKDYSSNSTITVDVAAQNDAPIITEGVTASVNLDEDNSPQAFALTLNATDVEQDPLTWGIKTAAINGVVSVDNTGKVSYTPNANYNGSDSFEVEVNDGNGNTDTISVTVDIAAQNDAPISQNGSVTTDKNKLYSFKPTDFVFADVDSGDIFKAIKITALETAGELFLDLNSNGLFESSEAIALNQKLDAADLGNLKFQSAVTENDASSQFSFQVSDGIAYSDQSYTMAINITTQAKPPIGEQPTAQPKPDFVIGETGSPTPAILFRGKGNRKGSKIQGSKRSEKLQGTPLRDVIFGNDGNDRIFPGFRGERFGNDRLFGGKGNDIINGGKGNDWLEGNDDNDLLLGDKGRDQIDGGAGNDIVFGGKGDDIIIGGSGDDTLTGGNERDMFVYSSVTAGRDTIKDFNVKEDLLDLRGIFKQGYAAENSFAQYQRFVKLEQVEMGVAVKVDIDGTGKTLELLTTLNNVTTSNLSSKNFVMA